MSKHCGIRAFLACLLLGASTLLFAAPQEQTAVAEVVIGRVEMSKASSNKWRTVKTGAKIRHRDQLRTFAGAQLEVKLANGSQLMIQENSLVDMSELLEENGHLKNTVQVKKGKVLFNIKKLSSAQSSFLFETPTATAAIRGTEGAVAVLSNGLVAYLQSGRMEIRDRSGKVLGLVGANYLASQEGGNFEIFQLPKDFDPRDLLNRLTDEAILQLLGQLQKVPVGAWIIESPAMNSQVAGAFNLTGYGIPGTVVEAREGSTTVDQDGNWSIAFPARTELGPFILKLRLVAGSQETQFEWPLVAVAADGDGEAPSIELDGPTSMRIDDGILKISGKVKGGPGLLSLRLDQQNYSIPVTDGLFSHQLTISDTAHNWNAREAVLTWTTATERAQAIISLDIDKSSPRINTIAPEPLIEVANNQLRIGVARMEGDAGTARVLSDGEEIAFFELEGNLSGRHVKMMSGVHDYKLVVSDQAGNQKEKAILSQEQWTNKPLRVEISSPTRSRGARVPPLPPGSDQTQIEPVAIRIFNLPDNDPRALKEIEVSNSATNFRRVITGAQLNDLRYDVDVPIRRQGANRITVKVKPKNGLTVTNQKVIEFGR